MDYLKRQSFFIICGLASAGGIALGLTGIRAMPKVQEKMEDLKLIYTSLDNVKNGAVNEKWINAERDRIELTESDLNDLVAKAVEVSAYKPLIDGVFPHPKKDNEDEFRAAYPKKLQALVSSLNPSLDAPAVDAQAASRSEIDLMEGQIEREQEQRAKDAELGSGNTSIEPIPDGTNFSQAGVLLKTGAWLDSVSRAHMNKAQRLRCYVTHFTVNPRNSRYPPSFPFISAVAPQDTEDRADPIDLWDAQLQLWIIEDVVNAINKINTEAAEAFRAGGSDLAPWVGVMPVKDFISIRISDFVLEGTEWLPIEEAGGLSEVEPVESGASYFTGSESTGWYQVVQFSLKLVMDQRDINRFVDELCRNRFHALLRASYQAVPTNKKFVDRVYGSEPTVNIVMDFQTVLLNSIYLPLMPDEVLDYYGLPLHEEDIDGGGP